LISRFYIVLLSLLCFAHTADAQKKRRSATKTTTSEKPVATPPKPTAQKKPDTVIIIQDSRGNVISTSKPQQQITIFSKKDTVIVLRKGQQKKVIQDPITDTPKVIVKQENPECKCVSLTVVSPDTLEYETYVNYAFRFKNNCKELVWISSESFAFLVFNPNGTPARVLRKLQYTKQYKYPAFVPLSPGEEYEFSYADDPFFQYDLRKGWKYRFTFGHFAPKAKRSSGRTYQCTELRDKMIIIK
jgi:hypothetical protein